MAGRGLIVGLLLMAAGFLLANLEPTAGIRGAEGVAEFAPPASSGVSSVLMIVGAVCAAISLFAVWRDRR